MAEHSYGKVKLDVRQSDQKQFDYVDPKNRAVQIEMEQAVTEHLKSLGAWLKPRFKTPNLDQEAFAQRSLGRHPCQEQGEHCRRCRQLSPQQQTTFPFNLIVVDNHSNDGTTDVLRSFAQKDSRLVHLIPQRQDLLIGGCWNEAIMHPACGRFAVQLDSDDIYRDEATLQKIVDVFHREKCATVIGSYRMTNFKLEEIPPGVIDHQEWTPENGRNNALRIHGLGAPRAFYTPIIRGIQFPETPAMARTTPRCWRSRGNTRSPASMTRSTSAAAGRATPTPASMSPGKTPLTSTRTSCGPSRYSPGAEQGQQGQDGCREEGPGPEA